MRTSHKTTKRIEQNQRKINLFPAKHSWTEFNQMQINRRRQ